MNKKYFALTSLATTFLLAACGGGGNDSGSNTGATAGTTPVTTTPTTPVTTTPAPATTASAEGVYSGTLSNGLAHLSLVLENDEVYTIYGPTSGGIFGVSGFLRGLGKSTSGTYSATDVHDYAAAISVGGKTLSASYVAGSSLNGTLTSGSTTTTFTGAGLTNTTYVYANPAKLSDVAGAWTLADLTGAPVALTVGADGKFTGTQGSCAITGSLTPRASGKNVFTFSLTSGAAPCAHPNQVTTGVAVYFTIGATRQLIAAGTDVTLANGTAFVGAK